MAWLQGLTKVALDYKFSTFGWFAYKGPPKSHLIINLSTFGRLAHMGPPELPSLLSIFDLWMACPQGSTKVAFDYKSSTFGWLARKGPLKSPPLLLIFRPLDGLPAWVDQSRLYYYQFSTFG